MSLNNVKFSTLKTESVQSNDTTLTLGNVGVANPNVSVIGTLGAGQVYDTLYHPVPSGQPTETYTYTFPPISIGANYNSLLNFTPSAGYYFCQASFTILNNPNALNLTDCYVNCYVEQFASPPNEPIGGVNNIMVCSAPTSDKFEYCISSVIQLDNVPTIFQVVAGFTTAFAPPGLSQNAFPINFFIYKI